MAKVKIVKGLSSALTPEETVRLERLDSLTDRTVYARLGNPTGLAEDDWAEFMEVESIDENGIVALYEFKQFARVSTSMVRNTVIELEETN